jgi:hypothetical protein
VTTDDGDVGLGGLGASNAGEEGRGTDDVEGGDTEEATFRGGKSVSGRSREEEASEQAQPIPVDGIDRKTHRLGS